MLLYNCIILAKQSLYSFVKLMCIQTLYVCDYTIIHVFMLLIISCFYVNFAPCIAQLCTFIPEAQSFTKIIPFAVITGCCI